jgi:DNA-binding beta-propeller fold protein YncE
MKLHLALLIVAVFCWNAFAADTDSLALVTTIPLPGVRGRIDHFALDAQGRRLFMAALGNDTVEVIDLATGKRLRSIGECSTPQGVAFVPGVNRLYIANGGSGVVNLLEGTEFKTLKSIGNLPDADNVRHDAKAGLIYVGYGDGALAVIAATTGDLLARIQLAGHPESFQLEQRGRRIFVNVPDANQIAVVDREKRAVVACWPMETLHSNFPLALDEASHRLFVGCRRPARLAVWDTLAGKKIGDVEIAGDTDDLYYDAQRKQIYASCGAGFIDVITQRDADTYQLREHLRTSGGARTSYFAPEQDRLYLAVRGGSLTGGAEIRVYQPR